MSCLSFAELQGQKEKQNCNKLVTYYNMLISVVWKSTYRILEGLFYVFDHSSLQFRKGYNVIYCFYS